MARSESAPITVSRCGPSNDRGARSTVVWLRGEHDLGTERALVAAIARAAQRPGEDVVVDLSEVTFMDASTVGALVASRNRLRPGMHPLRLRSPSPAARRVLEVCGLAHLVGAAPTLVHPVGPAAALGTWVDLPPTDPGRAVPDEPDPFEARQPARPVLTAGARAVSGGAALEADRPAP